MIKIIDFRPEHIDEVDLHWIYNTDTECKLRWYALADRIYEMKIGKTIVKDDIVLGVAVFVPLWPGVSEIWMLTSTHIHTYQFSYFKILRRGIKVFMDFYGIRRLQGTIRADVNFATKWIHSFGFEKEGVLVQYGPSGEDHYMFARVR